MIIAFFIESLLALLFSYRCRENKNILLDFLFVSFYVIGKYLFEDFYYVNLLLMTAWMALLLYISGNRNIMQIVYLGILFSILIQTSREMVYGLIPSREIYLAHEHILRLLAIIIKSALIVTASVFINRTILECLHKVDFVFIIIPLLVLEYSRYFTISIRQGRSVEFYDMMAFFLIQLSLLLSLSLTFIRMHIEENIKEKNRLDSFINAQYMLARQKQEDDENIKRMYHDIKNIVSTLDSSDAASSVKDEIMEAVKGYSLHNFCHNSLINAILSQKAELASSKGIHFECFVNIDNISSFLSSDVISVFGNLLDNAIEAAEKTKERTVRIKSSDQGNFLFIKCENSYNGHSIKENGIYRTTKDNEKEHGIGLKSIHYIAEKYHGKVIMEEGENTFSVSVILQKS